MNEQQRQELIERMAEAVSASEAPSHRIDRTFGRLIDAGAERLGIPAGGEDPLAWSGAAGTLARFIDHTALKPETTVDEVRRVCGEARAFRFASVCVHSCFVPLAASWLADVPVATCTVVGFPLGASHPDAKAREAEIAATNGADEIDMVLNVGMLKSGEYEFVHADIRTVVHAAPGLTTKVILETSLLTDEEKVIACVLAREAGAAFVKTSTGFSTGGATVSDVALMRQVVGDRMGVKAAGGIRTAGEAEEMIAHGASRIGSSASVAIVEVASGSSS